jgi:hypothetical protein
MHAVFQILEFWALAFVSLAVTLVLLGIFWNLIEQDLYLQTLSKEIAITGAASLVEAIGLWLLLPLGPTGMRAMIIPGLIVGIIYKIAHLEDWSRYEIICLLMFQLIVVAVGANLFFAHFVTAMGIFLVFAIVLAVIAAFIRGL